MDLIEKNRKGTTAMPVRIFLMALTAAILAFISSLPMRAQPLQSEQSDLNQRLLHAVETDSATSVKDLLALGASVDAGREDDWTPLYRAARRGDPAIVRLLLDHGANPNVATKEGWTPLMAACNNGRENIECIDLLLAHHASISARDHDGLTPLLWAVGCLQTRNGYLDVDVEAAMALIHHGADIRATDRQHETVLMALAATGDVPVARYVLAHAVNPNQASWGAYTTLMAACRYPDMLRLLLRNGARVNAQDRDGETALMKAAENANLASVVTLIAGGADPRLRTHNGWDALYLVPLERPHDFIDYPDKTRCRAVLKRALARWAARVGRADRGRRRKSKSAKADFG